MRSIYIAWMQEELSHLVRAASVKEQPQDHVVTANAGERAALAARFGLPAISRLEGQFRLRHEHGGVLAAALALEACVTQICVVTLDPFEAEISTQAELRFVPAAAMPEAGADEEEMTPAALDAPDEIPYAGEFIDLGAALAEELALALDPYPRKPGAQLPEEATDLGAHPFAALAARRRPPE